MPAPSRYWPRRPRPAAPGWCITPPTTCSTWRGQRRLSPRRADRPANYGQTKRKAGRPSRQRRPDLPAPVGLRRARGTRQCCAWPGSATNSGRGRPVRRADNRRADPPTSPPRPCSVCAGISRQHRPSPAPTTWSPAARVWHLYARFVIEQALEQEHRSCRRRRGRSCRSRGLPGAGKHARQFAPRQPGWVFGLVLPDWLPCRT